MTKRELKEIILECYVEYLRNQNKKILNEDKDKENNMVFKEGQVLPDAMEQILGKFPTLRNCLIKLCTEDFGKFIAGIAWVSPRPSVFRINLKNGQDFVLTWMGENFEATISGKRYYLGETTGLQQALQKLSTLYQEGPIASEDEEAEGGEGSESGGDSGFGGGSGGDFPGGESSGPEEGGEGGEEGEESSEGEEGGEDVGGEDLNFEADEEI